VPSDLKERTMQTATPYVDLYLLPVPKAKLDAYRSQATGFVASSVRR
jgi:hypothetical protein